MQRIPFTPPTDWLEPKNVDGYESTFEVLVSTRLPTLFAQLQGQMQRPLPLELFDQKGMGPANLLKHDQFNAHIAGVHANFDEAFAYTSVRQQGKSQKNDFAGIYVFQTATDTPVPFYVGITQTVFRRLRAHLRGQNHNVASFWFQLVRSLEDEKPIRRADVNLKSERARAALDWLRTKRVAILPLASPVERYAFELYASMKLRTGRWNSFETH